MEQKNDILLTELLKEFIGTKDILFVDFKPLDETTTKDRLDFQKIRGSVRLARKMIKTYADLLALKKRVAAIRIPG